MKLSEFLKSAAIIVAICVVFGFAAFGLNFYTEPIIQANNSGAASGRLNTVMPGGSGYQDITSTLKLPEKLVDASNSKRTASILAVHKETSGLGWVIEVNWTSEDTHGDVPNTALIGISSEGKITGVANSKEEYHDTKAYYIFNNASYADTYIGQDSTLADVDTVAGSTHSSSSFKNAVSHAFDVLVLNNMVVAGVKSDDQILTEMIPLVHPGLCSSGSIVAENVAASGNIVSGYKAKNGTGAAYIMSKGDTKYLVVLNAMRYAKVYDVEKNDVTDAHADLVTEALASYGNISTSVNKGTQNTIKRLFSADAAASAQKISFSTFNSTGAVISFTHEGKTVYLIQTKPYTYGNNVMTVNTFIGEDGKIIAQDVSRLIYDHYEQAGYNSKDDEAFKNWLAGYVGKTDADLSDDLLIAGVTISSTAVRNATADAFATFNSIKGGVN